MSTTTTATITTAETVARTLAEHPDGITTRELAKAAEVGQSTAQNALIALESAGTARRTPGAGDGKRRAPDTWRPTVTDTTDAIGDASDTTDAPEATTDGASDTPAATDAPEVTADGASDTPQATTDATDTSATDNATDTPDTTDAPGTLAAVSAPAAPVTPRQPDLKILIMAGVLGDHPDGVSAHEAITASGLAAGVADTILLAMEVAGAARRLPVGDDGTEMWVRGEGDLATVDPANAPTHVTCPMCGHTRPVRRATAGPRRPGTGRPAPEVNGDGSARLGKNDLRHRVEAFMRELGTGHDVTPGTVARELARSSGAVGNAMDKLVEVGVLVLTNEAPRMFALSESVPVATAAVTAHLHRPVIADTSQAPAA